MATLRVRLINKNGNPLKEFHIVNTDRTIVKVAQTMYDSLPYEYKTKNVKGSQIWMKLNEKIKYKIVVTNLDQPMKETFTSFFAKDDEDAKLALMYGRANLVH